MGLVITTDDRGVKVYATEKDGANGKFTLYSLGISKKNSDGNWESSYISCSFKKGVEVSNKTRIKINKAFPTFNSYNGKKYNKIMITDFDILEEGESKEEWVNVDSIPDSDLPFAD